MSQIVLNIPSRSLFALDAPISMINSEKLVQAFHSGRSGESHGVVRNLLNQLFNLFRLPDNAADLMYKMGTAIRNSNDPQWTLAERTTFKREAITHYEKLRNDVNQGTIDEFDTLIFQLLAESNMSDDIEIISPERAGSTASDLNGTSLILLRARVPHERCKSHESGAEDLAVIPARETTKPGLLATGLDMQNFLDPVAPQKPHHLYLPQISPAENQSIESPLGMEMGMGFERNSDKNPFEVVAEVDSTYLQNLNIENQIAVNDHLGQTSEMEARFEAARNHQPGKGN